MDSRYWNRQNYMETYLSRDINDVRISHFLLKESRFFFVGCRGIGK